VTFRAANGELNTCRTLHLKGPVPKSDLCHLCVSKLPKFRCEGGQRRLPLRPCDHGRREVSRAIGDSFDGRVH